MIDTHAHLNFEGLVERIDEVLIQAARVNVTQIINPASDYASIASSIEISVKNPGVFAMVGIHPDHCNEVSSQQRRTMHEILSPRVVAIGEVGLDYYRLEENTAATQKMKQQELLVEMVELAKRADLPLVIHTREAFEDTMAILREHSVSQAVIHCFTGSKDEAAEVIDRGYHISFTGIVTYPKNDGLREVAAWVPVDRLMVETDAPYLAPQPHRGKVCEPAFVIETARCIAGLRGMSLSEFDAITSKTAKTFFNLPEETIKSL